MIDLNNKILSLEYSQMEVEVKRLMQIGYKTIILTSPSLTTNALDLAEVISRFNRLKLTFKQLDLYLGSEINYHHLMIHRLEQKEVLPLGNSNYLFVRLPIDKKPEQLTQLLNYWEDKKIILSCVEEYLYFSLGDLKDLKEKGILLFANSNNLKTKRLKRLIKHQMIDFLGTYSDINDYHKTKLIKKLDFNYFNLITRDNYREIVKIDL